MSKVDDLAGDFRMNLAQTQPGALSAGSVQFDLTALGLRDLVAQLAMLPAGVPKDAVVAFRGTGPAKSEFFDPTRAARMTVTQLFHYTGEAEA